MARDTLRAVTQPARSLYDVPELYQLLFDGWTADLDFYRGLARVAPGPILECGVGAGRLAIDLARRGHRVHGVDVEPRMLAVAIAGRAALAEARPKLESLRSDPQRADVQAVEDALARIDAVPCADRALP